MYGCFACIHVVVPYVYPCQWMSEENIRFLGSGVLDHCEQLWRCWELNMGPLE